MTHPQGFRLVLSLFAPAVALCALTVGDCLAQTFGTPAAPAASPAISKATPPLENRFNKLEEQVANLDKKIQKPPKDSWDKLSTLSGFISGILVAVIGALVTVMYQRRETRSKEAQLAKETTERLAQVTKEEEDRKADLKLKELENSQKVTQLAIDKTNKEREIAISQAQTVRELLPNLQSDDEKTKEAALMLIAFLGNAELAAQLSSLYKKNFAPVLQTIASMAVAKTDTRRKAAVALAGLGSRDEAVLALVEMSNEPMVEPGERLSIADELKKLNETEKALEVQLKVAVDEKTTGPERDRAVAALKETNYAEKAKVKFSEIARDQHLDLKRRLTAIEWLGHLDSSEDGLKECSSLLLEMVGASKTPLTDFRAISEVFKHLGLLDDAALSFWEIGSNSQEEITKRYAATDNIIKLGTEKYLSQAKEKRTEILREMAQNSQIDPALRLIAVKEAMALESNENKRIILEEIIASPQASSAARLGAIVTLKQLGYADEANQKAKELLSQSQLGTWVSRLFKTRDKKSKQPAAEKPPEG